MFLLRFHCDRKDDIVVLVQGQKGGIGPRGVEGTDGEPARYITIVLWHCTCRSELKRILIPEISYLFVVHVLYICY